MAKIIVTWIEVDAARSAVRCTIKAREKGREGVEHLLREMPPIGREPA